MVLSKVFFCFDVNTDIIKSYTDLKNKKIMKLNLKNVLMFFNFIKETFIKKDSL